MVDVEDRDDSVWHNLTPLDGGLSGWRLLWDRWCPIPSLRSSSQPQTAISGLAADALLSSSLMTKSSIPFSSHLAEADDCV